MEFALLYPAQTRLVFDRLFIPLVIGSILDNLTMAGFKNRISLSDPLHNLGLNCDRSKLANYRAKRFLKQKDFTSTFGYYEKFIRLIQ